MQAKACISLDTLNHVPWDVAAGTVAAFWLLGACNIKTCGTVVRLTFLSTPFEGVRHERRVAQLTEIEEQEGNR